MFKKWQPARQASNQSIKLHSIISGSSALLSLSLTLPGPLQPRECVCSGMRPGRAQLWIGGNPIGSPKRVRLSIFLFAAVHDE